MSSGGARPRSGPAPDPTALRRDRKSDAEWVTLPAGRTAPPPEWPLTVPPSPVEVTHWTVLWATPQATQWEDSNLQREVAMYTRLAAQAEIPGAPIGLLKEARMREENLGLSYVGLLKFRWKIDGAATAAVPNTPAARPSKARPSARDRLKVVPAPAPAEDDDPPPF